MIVLFKRRCAWWPPAVAGRGSPVRFTAPLLVHYLSDSLSEVSMRTSETPLSGSSASPCV